LSYFLLSKFIDKYDHSYRSSKPQHTFYSRQESTLSETGAIPNAKKNTFEKSDAQVRRVNTFHSLQTIRKKKNLQTSDFVWKDPQDFQISKF
jgi:hypothetical protein